MSARMVNVKFEHGPELKVESGASLRQIMAANADAFKTLGFTTLGALVNNEFVSVEYRLETDSTVRLLGYRDSYGQRIYRHTIAFLLAKVAHETFPGCDFAVEHSLSKGLYCSFRLGDTDAITPEQLAALDAGLRKLLTERAPIDRVKVTFGEAIAYFTRTDAKDKLNLLRFKNPSKVTSFLIKRLGRYKYFL